MNKINHTLRDPNQPVAEPVPAATVLLVRDTDQGLQVFLMQRAKKTNFGGAWVFPGGKIDPSDNHSNYILLSPQLNDNDASLTLGITEGGLQYWVACIRECFEECGVLLARNSNDEKNVELNNLNEKNFIDLRRDISIGEKNFFDFLKENHLVLATDNVAYISHWVTPEIEKRRYSTRFFIAACPPHDALHDGEENTASLWINPNSALEKFEQGSLPMIMPTIQNLKLICKFNNTNDLLTAMKNKNLIDIPVVEPKFEIINGEAKLVS